MWDALTDGHPIAPRTQAQREALTRYNDVMLCKKLGWNAEVIANTPQDFYEDTITILNLKEAKEAAKKK